MDSFIQDPKSYKKLIMDLTEAETVRPQHLCDEVFVDRVVCHICHYFYLFIYLLHGKGEWRNHYWYTPTLVQR